MKIKYQVVNLELSKKIKELGIKQDGEFYYGKSSEENSGETKNDHHLYFSLSSSLNEEQYSAFTASELLELLPKYTKVEIINNRDFQCSYKEYHTFESTLSDLLAKMLIHLIENKLIEV